MSAFTAAILREAPIFHKYQINGYMIAIDGLVASVLAIAPKISWFKPSRARRIFKGNKNPLHNFLRRGSNVVGPMS
jgi:hypothetical protein